MAAPLGTKNTADVSPEEVRQTLAKIIQSKYFSHAPKKQRFVQLICDYYIQGRACELNEYLIGCEVFEKGAGYNPSVDPVVRVGAHDVRKKLELYYQNEGAGDRIRLTVPVGTYVPVFTKCAETQPGNGTEINFSSTENTVLASHSSQEVLSVERSPAQTSKFMSLVGRTFPASLEKKIARSTNTLFLVLGVVIFLLLAVVIGLMSYSRDLRQRLEAKENLSARTPQISEGIWQPFLANSHSALLILSNPVVHRPVNAADPEVLTNRGIKLTPEQANLLSNIAGNRLPLRPDQPLTLIPAFNMYTGIGEAIGAYRLSSLLQGMGKETILKQSRSVGAEDLKNHDVILLGSVYANQWSKPLSIKENFIYSNRATIENLSPQAGEEREYSASFDQRTGTLLEDYALVTVVPGVSGTNTMMFLAGIYSEGTQAAAEYVTDQTHLAELNRRLNQGGAVKLRYFQALLKVRVENSFPTQIILMTVREL